MTDFAGIVSDLLRGRVPDRASVGEVMQRVQPVQAAALAAHLAFSPSASDPTCYGVPLPRGGYLEDAGLVSAPSSRNASSWSALLLRDTAQRRRLGTRRIQRLITQTTSSRIDPILLSIWLVAVTWRGLDSADLHDLTRAMVSSGRIYDYREEPSLAGRRIVRRYATGAVSEKVALILPALIASASREWPVATAFLVSRSLSFTGGTWDKLSAVPGFQFPAPGDDTVRILTACGAAITVTKDDFCPADRVLYQLRSATGTVESPELIISSIASKQLVSPAHRLLFDVRYGPGAFLGGRTFAARVGDEIAEEVRSAGTAVDLMLTDTKEPTGAAVGNALEVAEAIAILNPEIRAPGPWDRRALQAQRDLVLDMYARLMATEFPSKDTGGWKADGAGRLGSGAALDGFRALLGAHAVEPSVAAAVTENPLTQLAAPLAEVVRTGVSGYIREVDQKRLGSIVNFDLGAGSNEFASCRDPQAGIIIAVRVGDEVNPTDPLCRVYAHGKPEPELLASLRNCFLVTP